MGKPSGLNPDPFGPQGFLQNSKASPANVVKNYMGKGGGTPATVAGPAPPPTMSTLEVQQAKIDAARQAKAKRGVNSTLLQGTQPLGGEANGDTTGTGTRGGGNTLLGGG